MTLPSWIDREDLKSEVRAELWQALQDGKYEESDPDFEAKARRFLRSRYSDLLRRYSRPRFNESAFLRPDDPLSRPIGSSLGSGLSETALSLILALERQKRISAMFDFARSRVSENVGRTLDASLDHLSNGGSLNVSELSRRLKITRASIYLHFRILRNVLLTFDVPFEGLKESEISEVVDGR